MINKLLFSFLFFTSSQIFASAPDHIFLQRQGQNLGCFYRHPNTNIYFATNNRAAGFSQSKTQEIITQTMKDAITQHKGKPYFFAVYLKFTPHRQYSIHEYRITNPVDTPKK